MSNSCKNSLPLMEAVFSSNNVLELWLGNGKVVHSLTFAIFYQQFFSLKDVLFLEFMSEPLVDLVFSRG